MKINEYKKLKKEIDNQSFSEAYRPINKVLRVLSVIGNFTSIFLASFFISDLISKSVTSISQTWVIWTVTLVLLGSLELIKRFVFDKFSLEFVKKKSIFKKEVIGLAFFSLAIIGMSFYSSLNGAKEFSSKSALIEVEASDDIKEYRDSVRSEFQSEIDEIKDEIRLYKNQIIEKDSEQALINKSLQDRGYLYGSEKLRNNQLSDEKSNIESKIERSEDRLDIVESKRDSSIDKYEADVLESTSSQISENEGNSLIFLTMSTIIEFLILIGIYFNKHYLFRSYTDMRRKINNDPNYHMWSLYSEILSIIYMNGDSSSDNAKLPTLKSIWEFCNIQNLPMSRGDLTDFMKLMEGMKITKTRGSVKFLMKDKSEAEDLLQKHFRIG